MNRLGCACPTLGDHEFDCGLSFLDKVLAGADFPFVCADLARGELAAAPRHDETWVKAHAIVDRQATDGAGRTHVLKVGLIGFVPPGS